MLRYEKVVQESSYLIILVLGMLHVIRHAWLACEDVEMITCNLTPGSGVGSNYILKISLSLNMQSQAQETYWFFVLPLLLKNYYFVFLCSSLLASNWMRGDVIWHQLLNEFRLQRTNVYWAFDAYKSSKTACSPPPLNITLIDNKVI